MDELIRKQDAIDAAIKADMENHNGILSEKRARVLEEHIAILPPVQPKIIHCKDCEHWKLQIGNVKGDGLGSCDFHNVNLVTGEGFCYWADMRGERDE